MIYDRREQVRLLNQDIVGEHDAILHYLTHAWTVAYQFGPQIEQIAKDEMRHLKWLAHTVVALQGVPDLSIPPVIARAFLDEALESDIKAEMVAIARYREHITIIADRRVQDLLQRIVVDEEDHLHLFHGFRDSQHGEPWGVGNPTESVEDTASRLQLLVSMEYQQVIGYLFSSFIGIHRRSVGMGDEDYAVDEMKHLGWIGQQMANLGQTPLFGDSISAHEESEMAQYLKVRKWARECQHQLLPMLDRIIQHERYQMQNKAADGWTVGTP